MPQMKKKKNCFTEGECRKKKRSEEDQKEEEKKIEYFHIFDPLRVQCSMTWSYISPA